MLPRDPNRSALSTDRRDLTFNFAAVLPGRASSRHTERAYFRWVETFLVDNAGWPESKDIEARAERMTRLPISLLLDALTPSGVRAWLGVLARRSHSKQGINQARAALVTLGDLLAEAGWLPEVQAATLSRVRPPKAESGQRVGRWLSPSELKALIWASMQIATHESQAARNLVVMSMLCTMALRREELAVARWGDLSVQNNRVVLRVHGKGRKVASVDVPRQVVKALEAWRKFCVPATRGAFTDSPLIRRVWKGGRVSRGGLTSEGVLLIVEESARRANLGPVAPHDLRRSVAGALHQAKVPIDTISRLLRHSSIAVTERYIQGLKLPNEGAVLMSDILADAIDLFPDTFDRD
ncbi:MAG: tyrosine-type recombinase/integrase [Chloroflexi bacterium]|nr:tyrosine-type recombinase/integrase [Chloroflexota bacterium]